MAVCTADDRSAPEEGRPGPWAICADARAECDACRVGRRGRPPAVGTRACRRPAAAASGRAEPLPGRRRRAVAGKRLGEDPRHHRRDRSGSPTVCPDLARRAWAPWAASAALARRPTRGRPVGATGQPIRPEEPHGDRSTTARHAESEGVSGRATGRATGRASGHRRSLPSGGTPSHRQRWCPRKDSNLRPRASCPFVGRSRLVSVDFGSLQAEGISTGGRLWGAVGPYPAPSAQGGSTNGVQTEPVPLPAALPRSRYTKGGP